MTTIVPSERTPYRFPALFIGHGTPMLGLQSGENGEEADDYAKALRGFMRSLPVKPRAIVVVSAHGLSVDPQVEIGAAEKPHLIYDFRGFPSQLYQMEYPCPGSPELAVRIAALLADSGFEASLDRSHGLDHGVWIPMKIAFPQADIPVVQVSLPYPSRPERILQLGKALAPLRDEGVLLVGSGGVVHNLDELVWHQKHGPGAPWALEFDTWVRHALENRDVAALLEFEEAGPHARQAQPSPEHFYPIFFTLGASARGDGLTQIFQGIQYESLSMSCFALASPPRVEASLQ